MFQAAPIDNNKQLGAGLIEIQAQRRRHSSEEMLFDVINFDDCLERLRQCTDNGINR